MNANVGSRYTIQDLGFLCYFPFMLRVEVSQEVYVLQRVNVVVVSRPKKGGNVTHRKAYIS